MLLPRLVVSVAVHDLYLVWPQLSPQETDTVLTVDTNAELPFAVAGQRFKLIAGRHMQISQ
jgi:hypothetical protein